MKSIKEKSNEYATEFVEPFVLYYTKDEVRQFEAQHEDSFEAGANYVLDEVECILEDNNLWDCEEICDELIALVEQLKK